MAATKTNLFLKRLIDIITALFVLAVLSPVIMAIILAIKLTSPGEVIYRQKRLGFHGKVFDLLKFRSMVKNAEHIGSGMFLEANDARITPIGKLIRKTGLDELPQLINVLWGEMSIVGPRPAPVFHLEIYNQEQIKRLSVKPGITGWAQVNGRVALYWPQRIELDLWYIENYSLWLDLSICFKTALTIFDRKSNEARPDRRDVDPFMKL